MPAFNRGDLLTRETGGLNHRSQTQEASRERIGSRQPGKRFHMLGTVGGQKQNTRSPCARNPYSSSHDMAFFLSVVRQLHTEPGTLVSGPGSSIGSTPTALLPFPSTVTRVFLKAFTITKM